MENRLHPFAGHASAYQLLCDYAERQGWKVRLRIVEINGEPVPRDWETLARHRLQLEVVTGFGTLPRARQIGPDQRLDELAAKLLELVHESDTQTSTEG